MLQNLTEVAARKKVIYCYNLQGLRSPDDYLQMSQRPIRGGQQNMTLEENDNLPIIILTIIKVLLKTSYEIVDVYNYI